MIPLWIRASEPVCETCGWAFVSFGSPWVAHLVWAIPIVPDLFFESAKCSRFATFPLAL